MFSVLHRHAFDFPSCFIIHPSYFLRIRLSERQLHLRKEPPKMFSVSSQVKYVPATTAQLRKGAWLQRSFTLSTTCHAVTLGRRINYQLALNGIGLQMLRIFRKSSPGTRAENNSQPARDSRELILLHFEFRVFSFSAFQVCLCRYEALRPPSYTCKGEFYGSRNSRSWSCVSIKFRGSSNTRRSDPRGVFK